MIMHIRESIAVHQQAIEYILAIEQKLLEAIARVRNTIDAHSRIFICGNGGSAADAQHFAAELTGRFEKERRGWPAVALTTDTSALTAIGNDYGFEHIFSRQLEALGQAGDLLIAISTSGNSKNVIKAVEHARHHQIPTIGLLGRDGGQLAQLVDLSLIIPVNSTARIQEAHILLLHLLCEGLEQSL
jgi:D-sedoheptulose 7-phosphate isomerase